MTESEAPKKKYTGRGGDRGGGRPKLASPDDSKARPNHGMKAWPHEWEMIKRFKKCIVKAPKKTEEALAALEQEVLGFQNPPEGE